MKKRIMNTFIASIVLLFALGLMSCSPKTDVFVQPSGDAVVTINITSSKVMDTMIANFGNFSEEETKENASIFDAEQIKTELENSGFKVLHVKTNSLAGISAKFKIYNKQMQGENAFVRTDMKKGLLYLSIGPQNIQEFVQMLSEEDREYLDLLMAPVLTKEKLNEKEYEAMIKATYGDTLANELKKSKFSISVTCPKKVMGIQVKPFGKGKKNGTKAFIQIPLTRILCVQEPIYAEVKFRP